jgi:hypothetical protein
VIIPVPDTYLRFRVFANIKWVTSELPVTRAARPTARRTFMMASESLSRLAVLEILHELIRAPSVNPSLSLDEAHGEIGNRQSCTRLLVANGVKSWLEEAAPGRPNAVAEVGGGQKPTRQSAKY